MGVRSRSLTVKKRLSKRLCETNTHKLKCVLRATVPIVRYCTERATLDSPLPRPYPVPSTGTVRVQGAFRADGQHDASQAFRVVASVVGAHSSAVGVRFGMHDEQRSKGARRPVAPSASVERIHEQRNNLARLFTSTSSVRMDAPLSGFWVPTDKARSRLLVRFI